MGIELEMVVAGIRRIREAGGDIPPEKGEAVALVGEGHVCLPVTVVATDTV